MRTSDSLTVSSLSDVPAFTSLDESIHSKLANVATEREFDNGEVVFLEGGPCAGLHIVRNGWLKAFKISSGGREQTIQFLGPGTIFNEEAVVTGENNQVSVEALEPSKVWIIKLEALRNLMAKYPALSNSITINLANHVIHLTNMIESLAFQNVESRLARMFLEHSHSDLLNRKRWSTQAEMAARLGTVPDVLNRALRSLAEEGLIKIQRNQVQILDRKGLERKAMQSD